MSTLLYTGPGSGPHCTRALGDALRRITGSATPISGDALRQPGWETGATLLAIPGGEDLPMLAAIGPAGARRIRDFVGRGGTYLGICAGAYFGAAAIHFTANDGSVIAGPRPLAFFPGEARGPLPWLSPRHEGTDPGTAAECGLELAGGALRRAVYWGGPEFVAGSGDLAGTGGWRVLARYCRHGVPTPHVAAVSCGFGEGRAILCAVHPELLPGGAGDALLRDLMHL